MLSLTAILASGLLALTPPVGSRGYIVLLDGRPDGAAALTVREEAEGLRFDWRAEIGVSASPCLVATEARRGVYVLGEGAPPDELAIPLAAAGGGTVTGLAGGERFVATARLGALPDRVELPELGISYVATPGSPAWGRCWPGGLDRGVALLGAPTDPRRWRGARFEVVGVGLPARVASSAGGGALPRAAARAAAALFRTAGGRDCRAVAGDLAKALRAAGIPARVVAGLLVSEGRLWPHAWTEARLEGRWQPLDATTGPSFADAGRIRVGTLEGDERSRAGRALLRWRHARVRALPQGGEGNPGASALGAGP